MPPLALPCVTGRRVLVCYTASSQSKIIFLHRPLRAHLSRRRDAKKASSIANSLQARPTQFCRLQCKTLAPLSGCCGFIHTLPTRARSRDAVPSTAATSAIKHCFLPSTRQNVDAMQRPNSCMVRFCQGWTYGGSKVTNAEKLACYGLFKQVTVGDNTTPQPWAMQVTARAKWDGARRERLRRQHGPSRTPSPRTSPRSTASTPSTATGPPTPSTSPSRQRMK